MDQQEIMFKLSIFEQQIKSIQEQLQLVEQAIVEASSLKTEIEDLKKSKDKEIMASIGKGIFTKARISDENLLVDVGGRNFVKKTISETQEIIEGQVDKLKDVKDELEGKLEEINQELTKVFEEAEKSKE